MMKKILIIGGTQEGNKLADFFRIHKIDYIISYAGIVEQVYKKTLKKRIGGFGGINGIIAYMIKKKITNVIDASHPFSNKISKNTIDACKLHNIPIISFYRKPWYKKKNDNWIKVKNFEESTNYLKGKSKKIFLAIGKKNLDVYKKFCQHFYLLRVLDDKNIKNFFPNQKCIVARGPFTEREDIKILKKHNIEIVISKNSGGNGAYSKILAARKLKIPVILISRPKKLKIRKINNFDSILDWINKN
tara:strand:+ start:149 stop:886 length:738 start_codon:yes stop_codon:yes gene_type:complete